MNVVFCGGGTAGHITPAIAIADALKEKHPDAVITFIGRDKGKENEIIKNAGYALKTIPIKGLSRSFTLKNLTAIKLALQSIVSAKKILKEIKCDIVIGTGGYVSWPVITAAHHLKIPSIVHESNAAIGLSTSLLSKKCKYLLLGSDIKTKYKNAIYTGNPIRKDFEIQSQNQFRKKLGIDLHKKLILSVGGSIGAKKLNDECIKIMKNYSVKEKNVAHVHICGSRYYDEISVYEKDLCKGYGNCRIIAFVSDMAGALSESDVVISRCGAMTLAEIAFTGAASILVPSPNVADNHQLKNARYFELNNAALLVTEDKIETLFEKTKLLIEDDKTRKKLKINSKKLSKDNATSQCVQIIESTIQNG